MLILVIIFLIFAATQLFAVSSAFRMDKFLKPIKSFPRKNLNPVLKQIMPFYNKAERDDFLIYSVILNFWTYLTSALGLALLIVALILQNGDVNFIAAVAYFVCMAIDTLLLCFEMVMLTFFDKKTLGDI